IRMLMAVDHDVLQFLAVGDEYLVLPDHRRGDDLVAGLRPHRILGVHVELPDLLAGLRFITAHPAVALADHDLDRVADGAHCRRGPLPVQDFFADVIYLPCKLTGFLVDRDHGWSARRRYMDVAFILPVRGADEEKIAEGN